MQFSSEFTKYQLYPKLPEGNWQILCLNLKQIGGRYFFDLLLADAVRHKVIPVLLNQCKLSENEVAVQEIVFDSLLAAWDQPLLNELCQQACSLIDRVLTDNQTIDWHPHIVFTELKNQFPLFNEMSNNNHHRRAVMGLENYSNGLKPIAMYQGVKQIINQLKNYPIAILDCACGSGAGSLILGSNQEHQVTGVDMDRDAVEFANLINTYDHVKFVQSNLADLAGTRQFDVAVSLETMEHVADPDGFLSNLLSTLKDDGIIIMSLPEARFHGMEYNSDHLTNWTGHKVKKFFSKYFTHYRFMVMECRDVNDPFHYALVAEEDVDKWQIENYFIVANKKDLKPKINTNQLSRKPLKILFVAHNIYPLEKSGVPIVTYNEATALQKKGHQVAVIITQAAGQAEKFRSDGILTYNIPPLDYVERFLDDFFLNRRQYLATIEAIINDFQPDIVHINNLLFISPKVMQLFSDYGIKIVREMHDIVEFCFRGFPTVDSPFSVRNETGLEMCRGPAPEKCSKCVLPQKHIANDKQSIKVKAFVTGKFFARLNYLNYLYDHVVDALVFMCDSWKNYVHQFIRGNQREYVIPLGLAGEKQATGGLYPQGKVPNFVYIGSISSLKGVDLLCQAFQDQNVLTEGFTLNIYGQVREQYLEEMVNGLVQFAGGKVNCHGPFGAEDLPAIMQSADIGIVPSYFETYCLTVREFLSWGKPVIAAATYGIKDIIQHDVNGMLFPVGNWQKLREQVARLLKDRELLERLRVGAMNTKVATLAEQIAQLEQVYYEVLGHETV